MTSRRRTIHHVTRKGSHMTGRRRTIGHVTYRGAHMTNRRRTICHVTYREPHMTSRRRTICHVTNRRAHISNVHGLCDYLATTHLDSFVPCEGHNASDAFGNRLLCDYGKRLNVASTLQVAGEQK